LFPYSLIHVLLITVIIKLQKKKNRIVKESLIFVLFSLFLKIKKTLVHTIWVIEICPLFQTFDDFNLIFGSFLGFFFFIYVVVLQFDDE
jgi:hypothetical protein